MKFATALLMTTLSFNTFAVGQVYLFSATHLEHTSSWGRSMKETCKQTLAATHAKVIAQCDAIEGTIVEGSWYENVFPQVGHDVCEAYSLAHCDADL